MTGSGTLLDPYIIYDVDDLQAMEDDLTAYYELASNIDASATVGWNDGEGFIPLGGGVSPVYPKPSGDIMSAGTWTLFPAGGTFASKVQTSDGDDSYIMAESNDCEVIFSFPISVPQTAQNIKVSMFFIKKLVSAGTGVYRPLVRIGGVNYAGSTDDHIYTWYSTTRTELLVNNPATGLPWTADEVNGIGPNSIEGLGVGVVDAAPDVRFTFICAYISYETPFTGHFDGKGFAITSLFMNRPDVAIDGLISGRVGGLFRTNAGTITGVALENCDITAGSVGGIASLNEGDITNCHVTGTLEGHTVGGFVNENDGTISECYSDCEVAGTHWSTNYAGGFVYYHDGTISKCYSLGTVLATGTFPRAGGFASYCDGVMTQDCYSRCSVTSSDEAGGFTGYNNSPIENCYSTGLVTAPTLGGFCRANYDVITDSFWDTEASGTGTSDGGTGKTTEQMKDRSTFVDAGWDFNTIWGMFGYCNEGYACLRNVTPSCRVLYPAGLNPALMELLIGV